MRRRSLPSEVIRGSGYPVRVPDGLVLMHPLVRNIVYTRYADDNIIGRRKGHGKRGARATREIVSGAALKKCPAEGRDDRAG